MHETQHQVKWNINVWCGILNGQIIGPYFYDGNLTGKLGTISKIQYTVYESVVMS